MRAPPMQRVCLTLFIQTPGIQCHNKREKTTTTTTTKIIIIKTTTTTTTTTKTEKSTIGSVVNNNSKSNNNNFGEEMVNICVLMICGIPCVGKSTLSALLLKGLQRRCSVIYLCYDKVWLQLWKKKSILKESDSMMLGEFTFCSEEWKESRHFCLEMTRKVVKFFKQYEKQESLCTSSPPGTVTGEGGGKAGERGKAGKVADIFFSPFERQFLKWQDVEEEEEDDDDNNNENNDKKNNKDVVIMLDDNFYYESMRKELVQVSKEYNVSMCQIFLTCPVEECIRRNEERKKKDEQLYCDLKKGEHQEPVYASIAPTSQIIVDMEKKMELPHDGDFGVEEHKKRKAKFQVQEDGKQSTLYDPPFTRIFDTQNHPVHTYLDDIVKLVEYSLEFPLQDHVSQQKEIAEKSTEINSQNLVHQLDLKLRRKMKEIMDVKFEKNQRQKYGKKVNEIRRNYLEQAKHDLCKLNSKEMVKGLFEKIELCFESDCLKLQ